MIKRITERGFERITDPYNNGRVCYAFQMLDKHILRELIDNSNFLYIIGNIVYFSANTQEQSS